MPTPGAPRQAEIEVPPTDPTAVWRLLPLSRRDPCARRDGAVLWAAWRTEDGPVTLCAQHHTTSVRAWAWGPGADAALARLPALCGVHDDPAAFRPTHPRVAALIRPGHRLARVPFTVDALLRQVLQQRVRYDDAARGWHGLVRAWGETAPGPWDHGARDVEPLLLAPAPERLARCAPTALRPFDIDSHRARTLTEVAFRARHVARLADQPDQAAAVLAAIPGVGPWTSASFLGLALGDPDAVPTGDVHLPRRVGELLLGDGGLDDAGMLAALAPFAGHRHRVVRALLLQG